MQLINPCNTIQVIPQDPNTCLFNTIMMNYLNVFIKN